MLALKCFQKMARFCPLEEIPEAVTGHVRRCLGLDPETAPTAPCWSTWTPAAITGRRRPGMVARRHFEAMVFTYLAGELRTGDIAVAGADPVRGRRGNRLPLRL